MSSLSQQAAAIEAAIRVVQGTAKPSSSEKAYLANALRLAGQTLRRLQSEQEARQ